MQIILNFERDFPDATIIKLEQNYRSTKTILDAAYHVVKNNRGRADKRLWTDNIDGESITLVEAPNEMEEAVAVVNVIRDGTITGDKRYADHAVLYRANSQSRALEEQFINYRIPYKIVGGVRFYERREIKDLLAYLRVILNPYDGLSHPAHHQRPRPRHRHQHRGEDRQLRRPLRDRLLGRLPPRRRD